MTTDNRFIHSMPARFIGLAVGLGILAFTFINWGSDIQSLIASFSDGEETVIVHTAGEVRVSEENPALTACLEERLGHVDKMLADGVINEHQHSQFAGRARSLCQAQNPS